MPEDTAAADLATAKDIDEELGRLRASAGKWDDEEYDAWEHLYDEEHTPF